jgi:uncharacterized membrane protein YidH (DUF202 family)
MTAPSEDRPDRVYEHAGQLERTSLSWTRTLLALAANGVLLVHLAPDPTSWLGFTGGGILVVTLLAWIVTGRTYRRLRGRPATALLASRTYALGAAGVVGLVGLVVLAAVVAYG